MPVDLRTSVSRQSFLQKLKDFVEQAEEHIFLLDENIAVEIRPLGVNAHDFKYLDISIFRQEHRIIGIQVYCQKNQNNDNCSLRVSLQMPSEPATPYYNRLMAVFPPAERELSRRNGNGIPKMHFYRGGNFSADALEMTAEKLCASVYSRIHELAEIAARKYVE